MNPEIITALENIGLTKGEINVYIALLESGETSTGPLIKKSRITGSKVYEILNRLIDKGLAGYVIKNNVKHFSPCDPQQIINYVERKEEEIRKIKKSAENIIPTIKAHLDKKTNLQSAIVFEGWKGVRTVLNMLLDELKSDDEYYAFTLGEELQDKKVITFLLNYHQKRIKKKIKTKIIANVEDKNLFSTYFSNMKLVNIKYHSNPVPMGVFIFGNYVANISFLGTPIVFLIKSDRVAESYRRFFESMWVEI